MMPRSTSAVDAVMGRLFERGHRKERADPSQTRRARAAGGAARRPSVSRMSRAGAPHGKAIFKLVRSGGTQSRSGLKGQLNYVFRDDKLARVIDPTARVARDDRPENADINRITRDWSADWWKNTRNGNTSHMILSYPRGVSIDDVETITRAVCDEMFESGDRRFKYIAGIHDDTEHHPHAHIVLNRRADDGTLFTMRSGTEFSYEGFRDAMAAHAERVGIRLDPTFRFERGITAAQPDRDEQLLAQKEDRAPRQQPRVGEDLNYHQELVSYARISFEAMAVIAHNADCDRLETAFEEIAALLEQEKEFVMPELSQDEMERFDDYVDVLEKTVARTETLIKTKSAAERAPMEKQLDDIMRAFTALNTNAPYAKDLHRPPSGGTVYELPLGDKPEAVRGAAVQTRLAEVEHAFGLDAAAVTARLEVGADSTRLEQQWLGDDARCVMAKTGVSFTGEENQSFILKELQAAYTEAREVLIEEGALREPPHLTADYEWRPPQAETYRFEPDRLVRDVAAMIAHYRENGAPQSWIDENKAAIRDSMADEYKAEAQAFVSERPALLAPALEAITKSSDGAIRIRDAAAAARFVTDIRARNLPAVDPGEMRDKVGRDLAERQPDLPHHVIDHAAVATVAAYQAIEAERARTRGPVVAVAFQSLAERGQTGAKLAKNAPEHQAVIRLLRENTTADQYAQFQRGTLSAIAHISTDDTFSRQLLRHAENDARANGITFDVETERRLTEHRNVLKEDFGNDRDRDRDDGRER